MIDFERFGWRNKRMLLFLIFLRKGADLNPKKGLVRNAKNPFGIDGIFD